MTHRIECAEPWFTLILEGKKPLTGRKNSPKYQHLRPGDEVELYWKDQSFRAKIADIKHFKSIEDYLRQCTLEKALPGISSFEEGLKIYSQWNSPQDIEQWGFIAIIFET